MDVRNDVRRETVEYHLQKACDAMNELVGGDWNFTLDVEKKFLFAVDRDIQMGMIFPTDDVALIVRLQGG